jgi:hypothetical protein
MDDFVQNALGLARYDRLVIPGGAACLAGHLAMHFIEQAVLKQLRFLVEVHELNRLVLIAHEGCAYYSHQLRVRAEEVIARQQKDLRAAQMRVRGIAPDLIVETYLARRSDARVIIEPVGCA